MRAGRDGAWVGVDIGKTHHWVCAVDENGQRLLSLKVLNDEAQILEMITAVSALAADRVWAIDILGIPQHCWSRSSPRPASGCATPPGESSLR